MQVATEAHSCTGEMVVVQPNLWWPHLMSEQPGHMMMVGEIFENIIELNIEEKDIKQDHRRWWYHRRLLEISKSII